MAARRGVSPAAYVASLIESPLPGSETAKTTWRPPSPDELVRLRELVHGLLRGHVSQLYGWMYRRQRRARPPMSDDMLRVTQQLRQHTRSLSEQTGVADFSSHVGQLLGEDWTGFGGRIEALQQDPPFEPFGEVDAVVLAMAQWFKHDFMTWIDPIKCPACGGETKFSGMVQPTQVELLDGAGRVESHRCVSCQTERRFMRVNKVSTLLRTREGRCGEFAHLFYTLLQARGIGARYIWNSEDHVWSEYWSPTLKHWVHVDSCEAEISKPLLYDQGWGKKQAFCLAFGRDGASDVTEAYVSDWNGDCQRRRATRGWNEQDLKTLLLQHTLEIRNELSPEERELLLAKDTQQAEWMASTRKRAEEAAQEDLHGRISGTQEWREARGEDGQK